MTRPNISSFVLTMLLVIASILSGCTPGKSASPKIWNPLANAQRNEPESQKIAPEENHDFTADAALAKRLESQGNLDGAIELYTKITETNVNSPRPYHRLAVLHDKKGQSDQSDRFYKMALERNRNDAEILCDYGYSRFIQGDQKAAESLLRRAIALQPNLTRAHNNLGLVLARRGKLDDAVAEFSRAGCSRVQASVNLNYAVQWDENRPEAERQLAVAMNERRPSQEASRESLRSRDKVPFEAPADPSPVEPSRQPTSKDAQFTQVNYSAPVDDVSPAPKECPPICKRIREFSATLVEPEAQPLKVVEPRGALDNPLRHEPSGTHQESKTTGNLLRELARE